MSLSHIIDDIVRDNKNAFGRICGIVNALKANPRLTAHEKKLLSELETLAEDGHREMCRLSSRELLIVERKEVKTWA